MMDDLIPDVNRDLMLDANAVGGMLYDIFGVEMTASPTECAHCGHEAELATLLAFTQAPGIVLRCSACEQVVLRIVQTTDSILLDARGAVCLRISKPKLLPKEIPLENDSLRG